METKDVLLRKLPIDLYNRLVLICQADKRSLNNGLQVLLEEAANRYFQNKNTSFKGNNNER